MALATGVNVANSAELIVSAAASLTNVFTELGKAYEKTGSGDSVVINFGGSGTLLQQIARGAPVDVFASADVETMDRASVDGLLIDDSRVEFARNNLVLITSADSTLNITSLSALCTAQVRRIAVSNPASVPVGAYSKRALQVDGLWASLERKIINTQHVRQSLDYVARGEVDVGFVYATDARVMTNRVKVLMEVPTEVPITYPIAVVSDTRNGDAARRFIAFVQSPQAQAILKRYGFSQP
ncbi:MAG: molybdate ABC transporter substrate-binding protein [Burkholderiales bacterium]|nr:molybdate ABC transporter substrate-binding protein [Burkholderiales bacterium]